MPGSLVFLPLGRPAGLPDCPGLKRVTRLGAWQSPHHKSCERDRARPHSHLGGEAMTKMTRITSWFHRHCQLNHIREDIRLNPKIPPVNSMACNSASVNAKAKMPSKHVKLTMPQRLR